MLRKKNSEMEVVRKCRLISSNPHPISDHKYAIFPQYTFSYLPLACEIHIHTHCRNWSLQIYARFQTKTVKTFNIKQTVNNYTVKSRGISPDTYGLVGWNQGIFRKIEQDNCFIIQHIAYKEEQLLQKSWRRYLFRHFFPRQTKLRISLDICWVGRRIFSAPWPYLGSVIRCPIITRGIFVPWMQEVEGRVLACEP